MPRIILRGRDDEASGPDDAHADAVPARAMPIVLAFQQRPKSAERRRRSQQVRQAFLDDLAPTPEMNEQAQRAADLIQEEHNYAALDQALESAGDVDRERLLRPEYEAVAARSQAAQDMTRQRNADFTKLHQDIDRNEDNRRNLEDSLNTVAKNISRLERDYANVHKKAGVAVENLRKKLLSNLRPPSGMIMPGTRESQAYKAGMVEVDSKILQFIKTNPLTQQDQRLQEDLKQLRGEHARLQNAITALTKLNNVGKARLEEGAQEARQQASTLKLQLDQAAQRRRQLHRELKDIYNEEKSRGLLSNAATSPLFDPDSSVPLVGGISSQAGEEIGGLQSAIYNQNLTDFQNRAVSQKEELAQRLQRQGYSPDSDFFQRQMSAVDRSQREELNKIRASSWQTALGNQAPYLDMQRQKEQDAENQYRFDIGIEQAEQQDALNRYRRRENLYWGNKFRNLATDQSYWLQDQDLGLQDLRPKGLRLPQRQDYYGSGAVRQQTPIQAGAAQARPAASGSSAQAAQVALPQAAPARASMSVGPDNPIDQDEFAPEGQQPDNRFFRRDVAINPQNAGLQIRQERRLSPEVVDLFRVNSQGQEKEIEDAFNKNREALSAQLIGRGFAPSSSVYQRQMADLSNKRNSALREVREQGFNRTFKDVKGQFDSQRAIDQENENRYRFDYAAQRAVQRDTENIGNEREDLYWANRFANLSSKPDYWSRDARVPDLGIQKPGPIQMPSRQKYQARRPFLPASSRGNLLLRGGR